MNDAAGVEMPGITLGIGHIIAMREKEMRDSSQLLERLNPSECNRQQSR